MINSTLEDMQRRFAGDPKRTWKMFLDFDSFFAHVEKQDDSELWEKPVAVAPTPSPHSGVIACCYAAKALGVRRGMKRAEATNLAPRIVFRHARHERYIEIHHKILSVIGAHVPIEKAWSVDEMSIDLKRIELVRVIELVAAIKADLALALGPRVTASFGIARTGLLAKIAAEMNKPDGLVVLHPDDMPGLISELPLSDIPGVARGMVTRLRRAGVTTTKGLLGLAPKQARRIWGSVEGERLWRALHGEDTQRPETKRGMFGHSRVLARTWRGPDKANECLRILCSHAAQRLRAEAYFCTRMSVSVKTQDGTRCGLQREFPAVRDDFALHKIIDETFVAILNNSQTRSFSQVSVMLMGIVHEDNIVGDLFAGPRDDPRRDKAVRAMDEINARYEQVLVKVGAPDTLPGGYDGIKIAFGRIPDYAPLLAVAKKREGARKSAV